LPIRSHFSQAVRLNGYTDGMVVPTGSFAESGVDMFSPDHPEKTGAANATQSYESNQTKIGMYHIPNEGNTLNNMIGAFTIEAYIIPDMGGVVLHKPNCYTLKVGDVRNKGRAIFDVHTLSPNGEEESQRVVSTTSYPAFGSTNANKYDVYSGAMVIDGMNESYSKYRPEDLTLPQRELLYVNAQFTRQKMRIYINMDLVGEIDFGGEDRIVRSFSSDVFIGGMGGEFRGVIESVRVSRGVIDPMLRPLTKTSETAGLWNFEDEIDIPEVYFYNNKNPLHPSSGKDGAVREKSEGLMPLPMVCLGYDFNSIAPSGATVAGAADPLTLSAGNQYGWFRIRDSLESPIDPRQPSAYEKLASYLLNIPVEELPLQSWWESGILDLSNELTKASYFDKAIHISPLNAVINASGTSPITGTHRSPLASQTDTVNDDIYTAGAINLDPMSNPIERVRIVAIDFKGGLAGGYGLGPEFNFNESYNAGDVLGGYVNRPPCVVIQSTILSSDPATGLVANEPKTQGFLFEHPDDTPVWFVLGNGDLTIDPGTEQTDASVAGQLTRPRGQYTRARFTQSQRFSDVSGNGNHAYWFAPKSRLANNMFAQGQPSQSLAEQPPFVEDLALWYDANDFNTLYQANGQIAKFDGMVVHWWRNKAPSTQLTSDENYALFGWGDGWKFKKVCDNVRGRSGLEAIRSLYQTHGPSNLPGGSPTISSPTVAPSYPAGQFYYGGSSFVNGTTVRIPTVNGITPMPFNLDPSTGSPISTINGEDATDGNWTFYYVITPKYDGSNSFPLLHSAGNQNIDIRINTAGTQFSVDVDGIGSPIASVKPTEGDPHILSIRIDQSNNMIEYGMFKSGLSFAKGHTNINGYTPTSPLMFDHANPIDSGFEMFGKMLHSGPTPTLTDLAPPGFIVHEIMVFPKRMTDQQDEIVLQHLEDKYGVDI